MARIIQPNGYRGGVVPFRGVPNMLNCGFGATKAKIAPYHRHSAQIVGKTIHSVPVECEAPTRINISRVAQFEGINNALFLVGDTRGGLPEMNTNLNILLPSDVINYTSSNYATYLLLKAGGDNATHFSTDNVQTALWNVRGFFNANGLDPQIVGEASLEIGLDDAQNVTDGAVEFIRVTSQPSVMDSSIHLQVIVDDCGIRYSETWVIIPLLAQDGDTLWASNLTQWVNNPETFSNKAILPAFTTNRGTINVLSVPTFAYAPRCGGGYGDQDRVGVEPLRDHAWGRNFGYGRGHGYRGGY